jgi:SAM-dependent methyltransferase
MAEFTVNRDSSVYYASGYWNDLPQVADHLSRRVSGDPAVPWYEHLRRQTDVTTFRKALFLNCGNGWVERELMAAGVIAEGVGIDISPDLLEQARKEADGGGLNLRYYERDINTADLPEDGYDLVVNYAAAHHIAYLDKVFRRICELLPEDGVFASSDYVGPHRNQYGYPEWQACHELNRTLPERFRQDLRYPHLPTMLAGDPTEAIHSELILETTRRYFDVAELKTMGGALAYLLLTFNSGIHSAPPAERDPIVEQVVAADEAYTDAHPDSALFAFFWGRPRKAVLDEAEALARWTATEDARETAAAQSGGEYYPLTALQELTQEVEQLRLFNSHLRADARPATAGQPLGPVSVRRVLVSEMERRWPALTKALVRVKHAAQRLVRR